MGDVHKFKRPPKNQQQFRGYRPQAGPPGSAKASRRPLRGWQRSVIAWAAVILLAVAIWAIRTLAAG